MESSRVLVGRVTDFKKNPTSVITVNSSNGKMTQIATYCINGQYFAMDNTCSHKQALLSDGDIEDLGKTLPESGGYCVRCPKHKSKFSGGLYFSLINGKVFTQTPCNAKAFNPDWSLATYSVEVIQEEVWVYTTPTNGVEPTESHESKFWASITLAKMSRYNHDCIIYSFTVDTYLKIEYPFALDKKKFRKHFKGRMKLDNYLKQLPYECWHLDLKDSDDTTLREYTPISSWKNLRDNSKLDLLIKLYPEGQMSKILTKAIIGTKFFMGPPKETIPAYFFKDVTNATAYACIAGGTGITPFAQMIKLIEHKLSIGEKAPKLTLLYSNKKRRRYTFKRRID